MAFWNSCFFPVDVAVKCSGRRKTITGAVSVFFITFFGRVKFTLAMF